MIWPIAGPNLTQNNKNKKASRIQLADYKVALAGQFSNRFVDDLRRLANLAV